MSETIDPGPAPVGPWSPSGRLPLTGLRRLEAQTLAARKQLDAARTVVEDELDNDTVLARRVWAARQEVADLEHEVAGKIEDARRGV